MQQFVHHSHRVSQNIRLNPSFVREIQLKDANESIFNSNEL